MRRCDVCGNDYDKAFEVRSADGLRYVFDSFECAIHKMAPRCAKCACAVIGHGVESEGVIYCSVHCAGGAGVRGLRDRVEPERQPMDSR